MPRQVEPLTLELDADTRRLLKHACEHWQRAVKGIRTRLSGMGYHFGILDQDFEALAGTDGSPGLVDRLDPQAGLFEEPEEEAREGEPGGPAEIELDGQEQRLAYFGLRKYRQKVEKLRRDNAEQEYSVREQVRDLGLIGDPEEGDGLLGQLDRGWEEEPQDPNQLSI